ncbi:hypothetical protein GCM10010406_47530 [Streptomyces thermolineatus]|uniref:Peptidase S11 D-alanyl-D-alanine carboxypeptidase A N-terminal domain-containing protein n=1 Tax=Streptomyces thermolineatus TaxID=44033 RepID=A0ABP5ZX55_9ACTN
MAITPPAPQRLPSARPARFAARAAASALAAGALLLGTAVPAHADDDDKDKAPRPPAAMSTVGGKLLGRPGTQVLPRAGAPKLPVAEELTARSWIVADAESGEVLASHNAHWPLPPASTLKMLFADTLLPKFDKDDEYEVTREDLEGVGEGSSLVGVKEDLTYTVHDLWLGVFLRSGNDAVHVLSEMNGGVDKTVREMQERADDLQAGDTHVVSPDGYDAEEQVSSAYDLSLFARQGLQNADFREYCSTVRAQFPGEWKKDKKGKPTDKRETFEIQNTNRLLTGAHGGAPYQGLAGVKNGYTSKAGNTFTGVAQRGERTLLVTVMHPEKGGANQVYTEAAALLDWGFDAYGKVDPVGVLATPKSAQGAGPGAAGDGKNAGGGSPAGVDAAGAGVTVPPGKTGVWTAVGITGGSLVVIGAVGYVVRRRWPLPAPAGGTVPQRTPRPAPSPSPSAQAEPEELTYLKSLKAEEPEPAAEEQEQTAEEPEQTDGKPEPAAEEPAAEEPAAEEPAAEEPERTKEKKEG